MTIRNLVGPSLKKRNPDIHDTVFFDLSTQLGTDLQKCDGDYEEVTHVWQREDASSIFRE